MLSKFVNGLGKGENGKKAFSGDCLTMLYQHGIFIYSRCHRNIRRVLGRNPDKSLTSFPLCYSQSPLQLCLEISFPSNSCNPLQFLQFSYRFVKEKGGKPVRKLHLLPYGLRTVKIMPRYLNKIVHLWIWLQNSIKFPSEKEKLGQ